MNIHEYQAKALLHAYGAPTSPGHVAATPEEAVAAAKKLRGQSFVVKAQIHAGGRGKGGGIKLVNDLETLRGEAERMLGKPLVTPQTGPKGRPVRQVYVVEHATIARELYLSMLVDRDSGRIAFIASTEGGMDIEKVAHDTPEKIHTITIDPDRLLAVVAEVAREARPNLAPHATLDSSLEKELGLDSLARVELVLRLEKEFGVALPDALLDSVFGSMVSHREERSQVPHLGLGLYIVKSLVHLMRGEVRVTSRPGAGTCFTVRLPLSLTPANA